MKELKDVVHSIEMEMIQMWSSGEVTHIIKKDPEFISMVMTAVHFDREHFRALGMVIGEA